MELSCIRLAGDEKSPKIPRILGDFPFEKALFGVAFFQNSCYNVSG